MGEWVCEHRDPVILAMTGFRRAVAGTALAGRWHNGGNAIAFSRGDKGFVAISRESTSVTASIATGLSAGTYCDLLTGGRAGDTCAGASSRGRSRWHDPVHALPDSAIAIHTGTRFERSFTILP